MQTKQLSIPEMETELERLRTNSYGTQVRREWNEAGYGDLKEKILLNPDGSRTNQLAIEKHGRVVNVMTQAYFVVPNFQVQEIIDKLLDHKAIGAKKFQPSKKKHAKWLQTEVSNMFTDVTDTEMVSSYVFPEIFDITGKGDHVQCGFNVRNSESGSCAFSISPFTHRDSCDNRMFHLANEKILGYGVTISVGVDDVLKEAKKKIQQAKQDYSEIIRGFKKPHTKSLKVDLIENALISVRLGAQNVINRYKEMYDLKIRKVQAEQLAKRMPKFVLDDLSWLKVNKKNEVTFDKDVTEWDAFNDITKLLTHEGRSFRPTLNQYRHLDKILVQVK